MAGSDVKRSDGELTLRVSGEVDWDAVLRLEPQWETEIDRDPLDGLVIDLSAVRFIDSTGIGLLMSSVERARNRGADVRIVKPEPHVFHVFEVVGLDGVLPFAEDSPAEQA